MKKDTYWRIGEGDIEDAICAWFKARGVDATPDNLSLGVSGNEWFAVVHHNEDVDTSMDAS